MRKLLMLFAPLLLAGSLEAQANYAPPQAGQFYVTPGVLLLGKDRGRDISSVAAPSIGLGLQTTDRLGVEFHFAHGETGIRGPGGPDVDVAAMRLDALYSLGGDALQPYIVSGLTHTRYNVSGDANAKGWGFNLGLGLRRAITDRLSLQLDGRSFFDFDESKPQLGATLGLRYVLDGPVRAATRPSVAEPVAAPPPRAEPAPVAPRPAPAAEPEPMPPPRLELVIEFEFDASALRAEQRSELDRIVRFMREHRDATASLEGHTDSRGSESYNQALSERRVHAVRDHLIAAGIERSRITTAGRGERQPVASNETDEGRQRNRRVVAIAVGTAAPSR